MRAINAEQVRRWRKVQSFPIAVAFSAWCPHCSEKVTFATNSHNPDPARSCVVSSSQCPGCGGRVAVFAMGSKNADKANVFIYPAQGEPRPTKAVVSEISEPLYRSYASTVDAFNAGNYVATAVCCRRTLEGLFYNLLPEGQPKMNLAQSIVCVAENVNLAEPIRNLANVLRQGGNLGAHFDMEKEPDREMALQMLKLLENLIDFLHVLPNEIRNLEHLLDRET